MALRDIKCIGCGRAFNPDQPEQIRCAPCIIDIADAAGPLPTNVAIAALEDAAKKPGWRTAATVAQAVSILNEALQNDPEAVNALMNARAECNDVLAAHPTIRIRADGEQRYLTVLGLINGVFGLKDGWGAVGRADQNKGEGPIVEFVAMAEEL